MKLSELEPRWIHEHMFVFRCPHCKSRWLSCKDKPMGNREQREAIEVAFGDEDFNVTASKDSVAWKISTRDFATMTVKPSINANPSGCWHGHIKKGVIC